MHWPIFPATLLIAAVTMAAAPSTQPADDNRGPRDPQGANIIARTFDGQVKMPYRLLIPKHYDPAKKYPLVLCMHGAGGRGDDNRSRGIEAFAVLAADKVQQEHPSFLLTPQCPRDKKWVNFPWSVGSYSIEKVAVTPELTTVLEILQKVRQEYSIDPARIYVTGQSMGGFATWDLILRNPGLFAAAIPICGAGDPSKAGLISAMPIWVFHGAIDPAVPVAGSREMVEALKKAGGKVKYTEYPEVAHSSWIPAWREKDLVPWLFEQRNPNPPAEPGK